MLCFEKKSKETEITSSRESDILRQQIYLEFSFYASGGREDEGSRKNDKHETLSEHPQHRTHTLGPGALGIASQGRLQPALP